MDEATPNRTQAVRAAWAALGDALLAYLAERPAAAAAGTRLLSMEEAAQALGIARSSLYLAVNRGDVATVRIGGRRMVSSTEVGRIAALAGGRR